MDALNRDWLAPETDTSPLKTKDPEQRRQHASMQAKHRERMRAGMRTILGDDRARMVLFALIDIHSFASTRLNPDPYFRGVADGRREYSKNIFDLMSAESSDAAAEYVLTRTENLRHERS